MSSEELFGGARRTPSYREGAPAGKEAPPQEDEGRSEGAGSRRAARPQRSVAAEAFRNLASGGQKPAPTPPKKTFLGTNKRAQRDYEVALRTWETERMASQMQQGQFPRAMNVMVTNTKGGVAKSLTVALLGGALAEGRGDGAVAAFDGSEAQGTLLNRMENPPRKGLVELLKELSRHERIESLTKLVSFGTRQSSGLVVYGSPDKRGPFTGTDVEIIRSELARYFSIVITDSANNPYASAFTNTLAAADCVVIPTIVTWDSAGASLDTLELYMTEGDAESQLRLPSRPELVERTVYVLTHTGAPEPAGALAGLKEVLDKTGVRWIEAPFDAHLAEGSTITFNSLSDESKQAWRQIAVAVTEALMIAPINEEE